MYNTILISHTLARNTYVRRSLTNSKILSQSILKIIIRSTFYTHTRYEIALIIGFSYFFCLFSLSFLFLFFRFSFLFFFFLCTQTAALNINIVRHFLRGQWFYLVVVFFPLSLAFFFVVHSTRSIDRLASRRTVTILSLKYKSASFFRDYVVECSTLITYTHTKNELCIYICVCVCYKYTYIYIYIYS